MTPVCFGSPSLANPSSQVCKSCSEGKECVTSAVKVLMRMPASKEVKAALLQLRTSAGQGRVVVSRRGVARRALTTTEQERLQTLSARARSIAKRLTETGWFDLARAQLPHRIPEGVEGTRLGQVLQLAMQGAVTLEDVKAGLVDAGLKPSSAAVEASTALAVLRYARLVPQSGSAFRLRAN